MGGGGGVQTIKLGGGGSAHYCPDIKLPLDAVRFMTFKS